MRPAVVVTALLVLTVSCSRGRPGVDFSTVANDFVYKTLSFSPVGASGQGLHKYNGQDFDTALDDLSPASMQAQRQYYANLRKRTERNSTRRRFPPRTAPTTTSSGNRNRPRAVRHRRRAVLASQPADVCRNNRFGTVQSLRSRLCSQAGPVWAHHRAHGNDSAFSGGGAAATPAGP